VGRVKWAIPDGLAAVAPLKSYKYKLRERLFPVRSKVVSAGAADLSVGPAGAGSASASASGAAADIPKDPKCFAGMQVR
jgi:hypothetical protein